MPTKKETARIHAVSGPIHGWATKRELAALFDAAKTCTGRGVIVEIGSWKGKSTVALGLGSQAGNTVPVFAIDPHTGSPDHLQKRPGETIWTFDEFKKNISAAGLEGIVRPIVATTEHAAAHWNKPIELLYLDVNYHDYALGKKDFLTWSPFVLPGGVIALHNTYPSLRSILFEREPFHGWSAPRKVLRELVFPSRKFRNIRIIDSTTFMERCERASLRERLANRSRECYGVGLLFAHWLYLALTRMPKPLKKLVKRIPVFGSKD